MRASWKQAWQKLLFASALLGFVVVCLISGVAPVRAATGIDQQLNFQGRLLNTAGATVSDGVYNIEFKIYQDGDGQSVGDTTGSPAGTLKWTEDHLVSGSTGVTVRNGYLSVQLGSVTPFGSNIDWNQDTLWLSVDIGNVSSCTITTSFDADCGGDGEMVPMKRLSASPYALNAGELGGLNSSQYVQLAQGLQTEAGNSTNSIYINKTGTGGNFVDLQASGTDAFTLDNSGNIAFGNNANHTISVTTAGSGAAGKSLTISAGTAGSGGSALVGGDLVLQAGTGGGTNGNGGSITIDAGAPNGSGTGGTVNIGNVNANTINIATNAVAHTVAIASGAGVEGVTIGSTNSTSSLLLQAGTGNLSIQTQGGTLGIGNNAVAQTLTIGNTTGATAVTIQSGTGALNLQTQGTGGVNIGTNAVAQTVSIGNGTGASSVVVNCGTGACSFGTTATAHTTTVGSTNGASITTIQSGTGNLQLTTQGTGTLGVGNNAVAQTIVVGNTTGATAVTIQSGTGALNIQSQGTGNVNIATNAVAQTTTIGNTTGASAITIQGGTGAINIGTQAVADTITIGNSTGASSVVINDGTGALNIGTNAIAHTITLGNNTGATSVVVDCGTGACSFGATATAHSTTIGSSNGASATTVQSGTGALNIQTQGTGGLNIGTNAVAQTVTIGNTTGASAVTIQAGSGGIGLQSNTTLSANFTVTNAGNVAYQKGTDYSTTGSQNNVNLGSGVLIRLTGGAAQTITGISGGVDGRILTLVNSAGQAATLSYLSGSSSAANQINTGTGADLSIPAGASVSLVYDSGASLWRVVGSSATTGGFVQLQATTPGTQQTGNFNVSGTGIAGSFDSVASGTLNLGTTNAATINIGTNAAAHTIAIGNDSTTIQGITIGSTNATSSLLLQAGTGNLSIQTQGGNLGIANNGVAQTVQIGNTTGATTVTVFCGTGSCSFGSGATNHTTTVGTTNGTATTTVQGGTGGVNLGTGGIANTVQLGNVTGGVAQTINIGTNATGGSTSTVLIGSTVAGNITLQSAATIAIGNNAAAQTLNIGNITGATAVTIQAGSGNLNLGTGNVANTVQIGSTTLSSGTQTINIGTNNTSGGTTNVTVGDNSSATGGLTTIQAKGNVVFSTNGVTRGTFDTANNFYFGNGVSASAPNNFVIQGTASTTTAVAGGNITLQGGNATVGSANGGSLTLTGGAGFGTGVMGSTVLNTPTFTTAGSQSCGSNCNVTQANVDSSGAVILNATAASLTLSLPDPTITTAGKIIYVTAANGSNDFTLSVNGGGTGNTIAMRQNTTATMIWNGSDWTAAGASSSTTLQSAYDNTLTSAGAAELILSNTSNHNGLTIRDSLTAPVSGNGNGTLLEVQTAQAGSLFSVNSNVTDYANNGGAESAFSTEWAGIGTGGSVARNTASTQFIASGIASAAISTTGTANTGAKNILTAALTANLRYNVSFAAKLSSGSFTDLEVDYSKDGTNTSSSSCTSAVTVPTSVWVKVNCTFTAPSSGITSSNAILIRETAAATRTWYVDNVSVTISADLSYATDGGVDDGVNFNTNWPKLSTPTTSWDNTTGNDTSDSAKVQTTAANQGIKNVLAINPLATNPGTLYRISVYAKLNSGTFSTFTIGYSPDDGGTGGANLRACADYSTQTLSTSVWTQITCYITTTTATVSAPRVYFYQTDGTARTFWVDTFSMTLATNAVPNVQIGGGVYGGPTTLLTLDRAASAPIASNNDALLGSMYYDTTLGKLQCYEADGWGACGSSPDVIVTLSPEYTNAVLHGTDVGTMTSDICSDALNINDGSGSPAQPTICGTNETYNFYKWTSPQATAQTYSIYVTYQLPTTFKSFTSGSTSLLGRTDSTNATVQYSVYRNNSASGLTQCGSTIAVSTGVQSSWQVGTAAGAADPSTCGFAASDSIVFKIDVVASSNADAYVSNLGFTFSNK